MNKRSIVSFLFLCSLGTASTYAQQPRIFSESVVSPPQSGSHDWYDIEADPGNSNNLIACGMKWDAQDNAEHGYVYSSVDGGNVWHPALEDKNSTWFRRSPAPSGFMVLLTLSRMPRRLMTLEIHITIMGQLASGSRATPVEAGRWAPPQAGRTSPRLS